MMFGLPKWNLKDLQLYKDDKDGWESYYFSAVYEIEEADGWYELTFPRIAAPVNFGIPNQTISCSPGRIHESTIDFGLGNLEVVHHWTKQKIKDKVREMTMDEIEKELGCKVKIISKK